MNKDTVKRKLQGHSCDDCTHAIKLGQNGNGGAASCSYTESDKFSISSIPKNNICDNWKKYSYHHVHFVDYMQQFRSTRYTKEK